MSPSLSYGPNNVTLTLMRNATQIADLAEGLNENAVANALDTITADATPAGDFTDTVLPELIFYLLMQFP